MDLIKYDMTDIWAVAGDVVAPDGAKIRAGWGVEVVPRQWWNWFENRQDQNIAYMLQKGFPEWDATTEYIINKSYVQRNGVVYRATATNTNSDPVALTSWVRAFTDYSAFLAKFVGHPVNPLTVPYINSAGNGDLFAVGSTGLALAATTSAAAARTVADAQQLNSNLTALSGVAGNVNALPYFTGTTTMGIATFTAFARTLLDDTDATAMRTTLGLGTAATANLTAHTYDNTAGRVVKVGDFGENGGDPIALVNTTNIDFLTVSGTYVFPNGAINLPAVSSFYLKHISYPSVGYAKQIAWNVVTSTQFMRSQVGGNWGGWAEVWTTDNLVKTFSTSDSTVGRMLKVGDFGFGKDAVGITDPDTVYRGSGFYDVAPAPTVTWANRPVAGWTRIFHQSHANAAGYATQIASGDFASTGAPPRLFSRYCINGVWGAWVELYHTGNSAALVAQVQAGIQPQLDAKVSRSGDQMSGQLAVPSLYALGSGASSGIVYLKALGSVASGGVDASITVDSPTAIGNGGRMVLAANTIYANGILTVTGNANFQGSIAASGQLSGSSIYTAGNINCLNITASNSMLISGAGTTLTVTGSTNFAGGVVRCNAGGVAILPTSGTASSASVLAFYYQDGVTLRGAIYGSNSGQIVVQTGANQSAIICDSAGNTSMKAVACNSVQSSGRVGSSQDLLSATHIYFNNGAGYIDSTANVYGTTWGGYLSTYLAGAYTQRGNIGADMAAVNVQGIGVYAFLQNQTGGNMGIGSLAAGGLVYASHNNVSGTVAPGTWRCMGWANTGGVSVYQRVA